MGTGRSTASSAPARCSASLYVRGELTEGCRRRAARSGSRSRPVTAMTGRTASTVGDRRRGAAPGRPCDAGGVTSAAPDAGLFGPDSVTWRVHADPVMALGGLRALLLQAVHPLAMAGVAAHSSFRDDPWGRFLRTAEYVGVVTYGTVAEAERAAARIRGLHRRVSGIEPESGLP